MKRAHSVLLLLAIVFSLAFISITACTGDDDDDNNDATPTQTPVNTPTHTPTPMYTPTPTSEPEFGTLNIWTTPVSGDIYVNDDFVANGSWTEDVAPGDYLVSFGDIGGYATPSDVLATVAENATTDVEGTYVSTSPPTITNFRIDGVSVADGETYNADQYDTLSITATLSDNTADWWFEWTFNAINPSSGTGGGNISASMYYSYNGFENCALHASNSYGTTDYYFAIM